MPKFKKKPLEVEAVLYGVAEAESPLLGAEIWSQAVRDAHPWLQEAYDSGKLVNCKTDHGLVVEVNDTREGRVRAEVGDFIVHTELGELYPCKPDIFEATYDFVGETKPVASLAPEEEDDDPPPARRTRVRG